MFGGSTERAPVQIASRTRPQIMTRLLSRRPRCSAFRCPPSPRCSKHTSTSVVRPESPHLTQIGSILDSYRPTRMTYAAHIDRSRSERHSQSIRHRRIQSRVSRDPLPLFQAYSQSVKCATVDVPCQASDAILRKRQPKNINHFKYLLQSLRRGRENVTSRWSWHEEDSTDQMRQILASAGGGRWTKKLMILVTSGYILQYSGEGHEDRLPEKMMELARETVAFASDAVSGRPWVMQVSQATGKNSNGIFEWTRRKWLRHVAQGICYGRETKSFLLVFDNPEDLKSWLITTRGEIAALGSRHYCPETHLKALPECSSEVGLNQRLDVAEKPFKFQADQLIPTRQTLRTAESEYQESSDRLIEYTSYGIESPQSERNSGWSEEGSSTTAYEPIEPLCECKDSCNLQGTEKWTSFHRFSPSSPLRETPSWLLAPSLEVLDTSITPSTGSSIPIDHESLTPGLSTLPCCRLPTNTDPLADDPDSAETLSKSSSNLCAAVWDTTQPVSDKGQCQSPMLRESSARPGSSTSPSQATETTVRPAGSYEPPLQFSVATRKTLNTQPENLPWSLKDDLVNHNPACILEPEDKTVSRQLPSPTSSTEKTPYRSNSFSAGFSESSKPNTCHRLARNSSIASSRLPEVHRLSPKSQSRSSDANEGLTDTFTIQNQTGTQPPFEPSSTGPSAAIDSLWHARSRTSFSNKTTSSRSADSKQRRPRAQHQKHQPACWLDPPCSPPTGPLPKTPSLGRQHFRLTI